MAKLAAVVDSLDGIADAHRDLYTKGEDGKYVLDADVEGHPGVAGLKGALTKERKSRTDLEASLKAFKDLGYTPEQIAEIKRKAEDKSGDKGDDDFEKKVAKRVQEALDKVKPDLEERDALKKENRELKLDNELRKDALAAGVLPEEVDEQIYLLVHGKKPRFDLSAKGKPVVLDDEGDPTAQSPKEWFEKVLKKAKPRVFAGSGGSGSGSRQSDGGSGAGDADIRKLPGGRMVDAAFAGGSTKAT